MPDPALPRYSTREIVVDATGVFDHPLGPRHLGHNPSWIKASDVEAHLRAVEAAHQQEIAQLNAAISCVVETFKRDEAQGYRSRDRQFAIEVLEFAEARLSALQEPQSIARFASGLQLGDEEI
jgi:hypothetical protein